MQIPLGWLKEYVAVDANAEEIAHRLTMGGLEVEGIEIGKLEPDNPEYENTVYAKAIKAGATEELANAAAALAPVLDVYITPNRGDCLSVLGVAREVAALYDLPLQLPEIPHEGFGGEAALQTSVTIENPDLCPRYAAKLVRGVKVGASPLWMQARLLASGQKAISNVVDVTNYVMLELGQPLHAFDLDKLAGGRIVVRTAREGETLTTLADEKERLLSPDMLVIADAEQPVALAGVMGGLDSEVSDSTTNLLIESAHFAPLSVRRTSRNLALRTEASYRFERYVDPNGVPRAAERACQLLAQIGQPQAVSGIVDAHPKPLAPRVLGLRVPRCAALLGMDITTTIAADCLRRLGFDVNAAMGEGILSVGVPTFRSDVVIEEDLIEEVGRIYGYENIPETLPAGGTTQGGDSAEGKFLNQIRQIMAGAGLLEVVGHSLTPPFAFETEADKARQVAVRNALSPDVSTLRRSVIPGLLETARHNAARGQHALALFEVGRVWQNEGTPEEVEPAEYVAIGGLLAGTVTEAGWLHDVKPVPADFYTVRGLVERLTSDLGLTGVTFEPLSEQAESLPQFHPGRSATIRVRGEIAGIVGEIHPAVALKYDLREKPYAFEISMDALRNALPTDGKPFQALAKYQAVHRDIAPRVAESVTFAEIQSAVANANIPHLESFRLTDVYRGANLQEGTKSLTLSFTFRAPDKTLSESEVGEALEKARVALEAQCGAVIGR
jgi:phenylalanyl-tRNA synthetase beta chain